MADEAEAVEIPAQALAEFVQSAEQAAEQPPADEPAPPGEDPGQSDASTDSGVVESEQPNPAAQADAEAQPELDPVLQSLPEDLRGDLVKAAPEVRELAARIRKVYDKGFQQTTQQAAVDRRDAERFRSLMKSPEHMRAYLEATRGEKPQPAQQAPEAVKRPRVSDFETQESYDAAMDKYEAARDAQLRAEVQQQLSGFDPQVVAAERALEALQSELADTVPADVFDAAGKAFGARLRGDPKARAALTPQSAVEGVRKILAALGALPSAAAASAKPNPAPRPAKAASVPARGVPQRVQEVPSWARENRAPTWQEAWAASGREIAEQGKTRAPAQSRNGTPGR